MAAAASFTSSVASRSHVRYLKATFTIDENGDVAAATGGRGGGAILGAGMVAAPTISNPALSPHFDTSVFKKEKVNLAGHEEVCTACPSFYPP